MSSMELRATNDSNITNNMKIIYPYKGIAKII